MRRRNFFQSVGAFFAGATTLGGSRSAAAQTTVKNVLITSAESRLSGVLADGLQDQFNISLTSPTDVRTSYKFGRSDLGHDASTNDIVRNVDAIVHVAAAPPRVKGADLLDYRTRGTYNLLRAASQAGVRKVVLLSTLDLLLGYDDDFEVTEDWRPLISTDPNLLSAYLAEFTCREFARESKLSVYALRLGTVVRLEEVKDRRFDPLMVEERDVTRAVSRALSVDLVDTETHIRRWSIFHIQSASPRSRFSNSRSRGQLGYEPQFFADV